jgi:hypothetical protein
MKLVKHGIIEEHIFSLLVFPSISFVCVCKPDSPVVIIHVILRCDYLCSGVKLEVIIIKFSLYSLR